MFEYFTKGARAIFEEARAIAVSKKAVAIIPEFVLRGLWTVHWSNTLGPSRAGLLLTVLKVDLGQVYHLVIEKTTPLSETTDEPVLSPVVESIIRKAREFANVEQHDAIEPMVGTEHVLLGILALEDNLAAQVLKGQGVTLQIARATLARLRRAD